MSRKYCEDCGTTHENGPLGLCDDCALSRAQREAQSARETKEIFDRHANLSEEDFREVVLSALIEHGLLT